MARMIPFPMLPTKSTAERRLYEGFLTGLGDEYVVYHSVDWVLAPPRAGGPPEQGEADFVVAHPLDGVLVLEAKGGELSFDPATRRWHQAGHEGRHALGEDPFHQARDEMHSLLDILRSQPGWDRWRPTYGYGVAFPDSRYEADAHPGAPADVAIDHDDMDRLGPRVAEVMRFWRRGDRRFGAEGMAALERALGFEVEMRIPLRLRFREEDRRIFELTDEQAYVLAFVKKRRRASVIGPAGSGKTVLATQLARALAAGGVQTLLTCFNWRMAAYLRESLAEVRHLEVFHFHDLCRRMAERAGLEVPPEPEPGSDDTRHYQEVLPALLARSAERLGPPYDAIVVDEAQDFRSAWWDPLLSLHRDPINGYLFVFADSSQNLYGGAMPRDLVDVELPLTANMRNTKPIHEFVSVFHEGDPKPAGRGPEGRPVEVLPYRDDDDLARLLGLVLRNLQEEGVALDDVAVLTPAAPQKSRLHARGGVDGYRLAPEPSPDTVLICTVHGFKGLERAVVILAELSERHRDRLAQYLYVGGSRARNHLIVLAERSVAAEVRALTRATGP